MRPAALVASLVAAVLLIFSAHFFHATRSKRVSKRIESELSDPSFLRGCRHVFLDVGSNVGIQVRKLFEPKLYPDAEALPQFDHFFGPAPERRKTVCAVGFEPNPKHTKRLLALTKAYRKCGWRVGFWVNTGVSDFDGKAVVTHVGDDLGRKTYIHKIKDSDPEQSKVKGSETRVIRLSRYVLEQVANRVKGAGVHPPSVLMKMDIEGAEIEVLADMITTGALQHVNRTLIEWHYDMMDTAEKKENSVNIESGLKAIAKVNGAFDILNQNDESYSYDDYNLPKC